MKKAIKPGTYLYPVPVVLVSCGQMGEDANLITIAWAGVAASLPPTVGIAIRPSRHSYRIIETHQEFTINMATTGMVKALDYCGVVSGRDVDKFHATGLTPTPGKTIKAPVIAESPISLECQLKKKISLSSHDLFLGEVVEVLVQEDLLNEQGRLESQKIPAITYMGGEYWSLGEVLGSHGFSKK